MSMRPLIGLTLLTLALLNACASVRHERIEPLNALRSEPLQMVIEPTLPAMGTAFTTVSRSGPRVSLSLELFALDERLAAQALWTGAGVHNATIVAREEAQRLCAQLAERGTQQLADMQLEIFAGNAASTSLTKQTAYLGAFEVSSTDEQAIADPRIDIAVEGVLFNVTVARDPDAKAIEFSFELLQSVLDRPLAERKLSLMPGTSPVVLQTPSGLARTISARSTLNSAEALVFAATQLGGDQEGRAILAVITAELELP